jgi:tryptophan-rich sensory protein
MKSFKKLLPYLGLPLAVGGLSALLSGNLPGYRELIRPPLSPPGWIFPVVWTVLYLLMGWASFRVAEADVPKEVKRQGQRFYRLQLLANFLWSPVFFRLELRLLAFGILLVLWLLICLTIHRFSAVDEKAGDLLLPYLLWVTFAGYLNLGVALLN